MKSYASPDFQSKVQFPSPHLSRLACFVWMHHCCAGRTHTYACSVACTQGLFMARACLGCPVTYFHFINVAYRDGRLRMNYAACISQVMLFFAPAPVKPSCHPYDGLRCCWDGIFEFWIIHSVLNKNNWWHSIQRSALKCNFGVKIGKVDRW